MTFDEAKVIWIPFGRHWHKSLEELGRTEEGLLFLDKIRGWEHLFDEIGEAIEVYLTHESVAPRLDAALYKDPFHRFISEH